MRDPIGVKDEDYFEKKEGIFTLQYPFEKFPVPDTGRYQLHNEIDDCIVCDKCAKVCPVNCIDIEPIRAVDEIGKTSDGTPKRIYAAKFDIDMAKCCFCGLCTTVCPTECLTMTKEYDFSVFDLKEHNFAFGEMSETEVVEKKAEFEEFNAQKQKEKEQKAKEAAEASKEEGTSAKQKPAFKPKVKTGNASDTPKAGKPIFKPKVKTGGTSDAPKAAKPVFRPKVKTKPEAGKIEETSATPKPKFRPKIKPKVQPNDQAENVKSQEENTEKEKPKKPVFRPKIKPKK